MSQMNIPLVSVVLGSYNRHAFLKATLESVRANAQDFPYEIIVVDGGSTDGSLRYLTKQKDVITIIQHNRGVFRGKPIKRRSWGYFINLGFKSAQGKYILMISDDCLLVPEAVKNGVELFEKYLAKGRKVGAMAFYWRDWPESQQYWVGTIYEKVFVNHGLFLREALEEVNWIDEETYQFYHADGDLCLRLWQKGYEVMDSPDSFVEHYSHSNSSVRRSNAELQKADWKAFEQRWPEMEGNKANAGSITRNFEDPNRTYRNFPGTERILLDAKKVRQGARGILEKVFGK